MKNILDKIVENKKLEIKKSKALISIQKLQTSPLFNRQCFSFAKAIKAKSGIIAEFKRKSPSKGVINRKVIVEEVVSGYQKAGVSAISVLTDTKFFGGTFNDLIRARSVVNVPILRKDFIIDNYQLYEAKAIGADVILLIAAILTPSECLELAKTAKELGLNVFLELHSQEELQHVNEYIDVIGINNRNLKTFEVDIENSIRLANSLPKNIIKVAESGISNPEVIAKMKKEGFEGFLIGENFMKSQNPGNSCKEFIATCNQL